MQPRVYLGSSSVARRAILKDKVLGLNVEVVLSPSNVEEITDKPNMEDLVVENTRRKTTACIKELRQKPEFGPDDVLICGDAVIFSAAGVVYNKPHLLEAAQKCLAIYDKDKRFGACQAVEVTHLASGERFLGVEVCTCTIDGIPEEGRDVYLQKSGALHAAGGLIIEDPFIAPHILSVTGGSRESVMGLSLELVRRLMTEAGAKRLLRVEDSAE